MFYALAILVYGLGVMLLAGLLASAKRTQMLEQTLAQSHFENGKEPLKLKSCESHKTDSLRQFNLLKEVWPDTSFCITTRHWCYVHNKTEEQDFTFSLYNHITGQILHGDSFEQVLEQAQFPCASKNHKLASK